ncbi:MAG: type IV pilin protein [Pseudomonadota bacterium]
MSISIRATEAGLSLIELIIAALIASITAAIAIPSYSNYRLRAERSNGAACMINLARLQEAYFVRHNSYTVDLKALGYNATAAASCAHTSQYLLSAFVVDEKNCPLSRCYRLKASPQGAQVSDGDLHLIYNSAEPDPNLRTKKERSELGSGIPWI